MCILFMHLGISDPGSDYSLILAANRDELYDRPSKNMAPWEDDQDIIGGGCHYTLKLKYLRQWT